MSYGAVDIISDWFRLFLLFKNLACHVALFWVQGKWGHTVCSRHTKGILITRHLEVELWFFTLAMIIARTAFASTKRNLSRDEIAMYWDTVLRLRYRPVAPLSCPYLRKNGLFQRRGTTPSTCFEDSVEVVGETDTRKSMMALALIVVMV